MSDIVSLITIHREKLKEIERKEIFFVWGLVISRSEMEETLEIAGDGQEHGWD